MTKQIAVHALIAWLLLAALPGAEGQEMEEFSLRIHTLDGSMLPGKARLPTRLTVKSKYGEVQVVAASITQISRTSEGKWQLSTRDAGTIIGDCTLGKVEIQTPGGKLTIEESDIRQITFDYVPKPAAPNAPVPPPAAGATTPPGGDAKPVAAKSSHWVLSTGTIPPPADARPGGRREWRDLAKTSTAATEDAAYLAVVHPDLNSLRIVDTAARSLREVPVDANPVYVAEHKGLFWVCCTGSSALVSVDPKTGKVAGRIAMPAPPYCLAPARSTGVAYAIVGEYAKRQLHTVDLAAKRELGPVKNVKGLLPMIYMGGVSQTADGRYVYVQGEFNHSPSGAPDVFMNRNGVLTQVHNIHDSVAPLRPDLKTQRVYAGGKIFGLDLKTTAGSIPANLSAPAPEQGLVVGALTPAASRWEPSRAVGAFDAESFAPRGNVDLGPDAGILGLYPGKTAVHVLTATEYFAIPFDALGGKGASPADGAPKTRDLSKEATPAELEQARAACTRGDVALAAKKYAEAAKAFEEAESVDPLGGGLVGRARVLNAKAEYDKAIELLAGRLDTPFRDDATILEAYGVLGEAYVQASRPDEGIRVLQDGLKLEPDSVKLLLGLGAAAAAAKKDALAYCAWSRAVKKGTAPASAKSDLAACEARIRKETTGTCPACEGKGQDELVVEEQNGTRKRLIRKCDACQGAKKIWKRPCADCWGLTSPYNECKTCWGRGFRFEPAQ